LLNISETLQVRGLNLPQPLGHATFTFNALIWYQAPFVFEKLKTKIVTKKKTLHLFRENFEFLK